MSLINDALKRASQAQPPPLPGSETAPPMRPVEPNRPSSWPLFVVPVVLLIVLAVAGWFLLKGLAASQRANLTTVNTPVAARELPAERRVTPEPVPEAAQTREAVNGPAESPGARNRTTSKPVQTSRPGEVTKTTPNPSKEEAAAPETAEPTFPSLKLQGLFYRSTRPSVVINSKTLSVGDRIENAKVVAIERDSVTVEWGGEKRVLTLN